MSKKIAPKAQPVAPPPPPRRSRGLIALIVVAVAAIGSFAYMSVGRSESDQQAQTAPAGSLPPAPPPLAPLAGPPVNARFGPHKQASLPPLPFGGYPPPRPVDVVGAVYQFAAEHPEVLGYMPCYCGCERSGHRGNDDCFVGQRAANGDVIDWEPHGMT